MRKALVQLAYVDTYHGFVPAFENPQDCEMWLDAMHAKYDGRSKPFGRAEFDYFVRPLSGMTFFSDLRVVHGADQYPRL